jgi:hypothetical protein
MRGSSLWQIHVRLDDLDLGLCHRSTQGVVQDRDLSAGQAHPTTDQQQDEQEKHEPSHPRKGTRATQAPAVLTYPPASGSVTSVSLMGSLGPDERK